LRQRDAAAERNEQMKKRRGSGATEDRTVPASAANAARYDRRGGRQALVVELRPIGAGGTITLPVEVEPADDATPDLFHRAGVRSRVFGESVRGQRSGSRRRLGLAFVVSHPAPTAGIVPSERAAIV